MRNAACLLSAGALILALLLPQTAAGQTSRINGVFLFGANMPWLNWGADFGGGPNGGGVSGDIAQVDTKLSAAHTAGMKMVRWWVFEGGSPQIQRDGSGTPTGINPTVYTDIDAALTEAAKYDIYYNLVLFGGTNDDSTTHQWWEDATKRQALVNVLTPLFQHYAGNPRVHTWEVVNEPEWQSRNGITSVSGMLATGDAIANAVHANSRALVTVGNAQVQDVATWQGHPLDYYSPHYYDNFGTGSNDPFVTAASSPDGKPVVIGESQESAGLTPSAQTRWQDLYNLGYAGGWPWSLSPEHTSDQIAIDLSAAAAFAQGKPDLGPQSATVSPTSTPTQQATATPTVLPTSTPTPAPSTPTPTPVAGGQATWTSHASVSAATVARGKADSVTAHVTVNQSASALVDVEIYDPAGNKVAQRYWDNHAFSPNTSRTYRFTWTVPTTAATGTYTVMVGVFAPGWGVVYSWNNDVATFTVD
ncbi:MAG: hypothetical protein JOZ81_09765 [Chloroflexi bacterium]|nr:hypothetical protein [Chloroflexota bacterium]